MSIKLSMYYSKVIVENMKYLATNESLLESVESTSFLGICIDENLNWKKHINSVCNVLSKKSDFCIEYDTLFLGKS